MSHHVIDISTESCLITCKQGQLICRPEKGPEQRMPMEDVGAILINSFSAVVHNQVILQAVRHGVVIVFCERFRPSGILLPANRATDTLLTRAQLNLSDAMRRAFWRRTVTAKCMNQASYMQTIAPDDPRCKRLINAAASQRTDKESRCARLYWSILSRHLSLGNFRRLRYGNGLNNLLNYGYAVLLARVLQKLFAVGLDPTFGVGHVVRERATPLAYDLMEPFRIAVDARVVAWVTQKKMESTSEEGNIDDCRFLEVSQEFKKWVQGVLQASVPYEKTTLNLEHLIEHVLRGFREALLARQPGSYKPWALRNIKWDGCL